MSQRRIKPLKAVADWTPLPASLERAFSEVEAQRPAYFDDDKSLNSGHGNGSLAHRRRAR